MRRRNWRRSRFDDPDDEPLGPLSNLVDIMLVFACGLIAALAAQQASESRSGGREITEGRELPEVPDGVGEAGSGYEAVGQVYREPETGEMVLIDATGGNDR
ncbi:MAG: hypothetical protein V5A42_05025 [Halofilum sp. (in: g-proteobacteria)]